MTTCQTHTRVRDERGVFANRLPVQPCESGADYGVWTEDDGGFLCTFDCAMQAANYAAELLAEDDDQELKILRECHDHPGQREDGCEDCFGEDDKADDEQDDEDEDWS